MEMLIYTVTAIVHNLLHSIALMQFTAECVVLVCFKQYSLANYRIRTTAFPHKLNIACTYSNRYNCN